MIASRLRLLWNGADKIILCVCIAAFLFGNLLSYSSGFGLLSGFQECNDCIKTIGWPFVVFEEGGLAYRREVHAWAFLADLGLGFGASIAASLAFPQLQRVLIRTKK